MKVLEEQKEEPADSVGSFPGTRGKGFFAEKDISVTFKKWIRRRKNVICGSDGRSFRETFI